MLSPKTSNTVGPLALLADPETFFLPLQATMKTLINHREEAIR